MKSLLLLLVMIILGVITFGMPEITSNVPVTTVIVMN